MAAEKLEVVITEDRQGYYLSAGENETQDSAEWGMPIEFDGKRYLADVDDEGQVDLFLLTPLLMSHNDFEITEESSDGDEDEEDGEEDEDEADEATA